ncbi:MAG TPA: hypothetical protein VKY73_06695 [Polyangiaceae bacterium]|nr:hypothetical protein [Polyangiaceae bacterium]
MRLRASSLVAITTCFALSCELGADVAHRGAYGFLPSAAVPDTTLRPLRHLLVVEEDPASERTLLYYFEGELGRAGIGLESLPRLARRHGRSAVRFESPLATLGIPEPPASGGAAGASGAPSDTLPRGEAGASDPGGAAGEGSVAGAGGAPGSAIEREALVVELEGSSELVTLERIEAFELEPTGASRFAPSLGANPPVRAFFGVRRGQSALPPLRIDTDGRPLRFTPALRALEPAPSRENALLVADYAPSPTADYLLVDLFQTIHRDSDAAPFDAILGVALAPSTRYLVSPELLASAFELGCWSLERPLHLRVTQVSRAYELAAAGDFAVVHRRHDAIEVPASLWSDTVASVGTAAYCADFY